MSFYGKHGQNWDESYHFSSEKDKKSQVEEKIKILKEFLVKSPESYRSVLNKAESPIALDRICRSIILGRF